MRIGEVCQRMGMTKDSVRHYEEVGLIHSHKVPAGTRFYQDFDDVALTRLDIIRCGKSCGFTLKEMKQIFDASDAKAVSLKEVKPFLEAKLVELDQKIAEIEKMKDVIRENLNEIADMA